MHSADSRVSVWQEHWEYGRKGYEEELHAENLILLYENETLGSMK